MQILIHFSNVIYLFSYLVKDILWLRLLTVLGGALLLTFYLLQPTPLWAAVGWNAVFSAINIYQIYLLLLERRPIQLQTEEHRLHQLVFQMLTPREFVKLLALGEWLEAEPEEVIVTRGRMLDRMMVICEGRTAVQIDGKQVVQLREGQLIGEMSFLTGQTPNADVVAVEPTRYVAWPKDVLKKFLDGNLGLRATMQTIIGADLAVKLRTAA